MASQIGGFLISLGSVVLSLNVCAETSLPTYTVHHAAVSFDQALDRCSPGVLTSLATEHEVTNVLQRISESLMPQNEFTFWVGLKKGQNRCVVPTLPLRGFQWTEDGSEESQVSRWTKEPQDTCTTVRCAALQGLRDGSTVSRWGLIPVTCRNTSVYPFICKLRHSESTSGVTFKTDPLQPKPSEPEFPVREPYSPKIKTELQSPDPGPTSGPVSGSPPASGSHHKPGSPPGSGPSVWSNMCQNPLVLGARSLSPDPNNSSKILVECWSTVELELHCRGYPAEWRLPNDFPADLSTICQPCSDGFHKDASGTCVDVDECSGAPCRHTCLNTEGSFRCVCTDKDGRHSDEGSPVCTDTVTKDEGGSLSGILIPALVAVAVLVVLIVIVVVTVKCFLMRRSRTRDINMSEKMAMKN